MSAQQPRAVPRGGSRAGTLAPDYMAVADGARLLAVLNVAPGTCRVLQCIAARRGEGASSVARDIALIGARTLNLRVLLLDLDPPGRQQAETLRARCLERSAAAPVVQLLPGQTQSGSSAQVAVLRFDGVGALVSEVQGAWPGAVVIWDSAIEVLRASFDLIVVDSPSLEAGFEGVVLAPQMDANLIVVQAESTRTAVAQNLRDQLREVGAPIGGVVLNRRRFHIPRFIYRYI
jgi:Mrp family chromosome partitioning ATPase